MRYTTAAGGTLIPIRPSRRTPAEHTVAALTDLREQTRPFPPYRCGGCGATPGEACRIPSCTGSVEAVAFPLPLCLTCWPVSTCLCGGDLGALLGVLVHVDTCGDCRDRPGRCEHRDLHTACHDPEAAECEHHHCHEPHSIASEACTDGHDLCCGCCHREA